MDVDDTREIKVRYFDKGGGIPIGQRVSLAASVDAQSRKNHVLFGELSGSTKFDGVQIVLVSPKVNPTLYDCAK